jgi:hypothetical protein
LNENAMSFVSARDFLVSDDKFPTCSDAHKVSQQMSRGSFQIIDDGAAIKPKCH